mmetsp:Transcript_19248/g.53670  ORF Transcript_19248/g.53670 Transcript_19248/m.53670 type:complete len:625 (-) Transcript_19248:116-1990(-)
MMSRWLPAEVSCQSHRWSGCRAVQCCHTKIVAVCLAPPLKIRHRNNRNSFAVTGHWLWGHSSDTAWLCMDNGFQIGSHCDMARKLQIGTRPWSPQGRQSTRQSSLLLHSLPRGGDGTLYLEETSLQGLAELSRELSASPDQKRAAVQLQEVAGTVRRRLANKTTGSIQRWELQAIVQLVEAFVSSSHLKSGTAASMFDGVTTAAVGLLKRGSVRMPEQAGDICALLRHLGSASHRSIAVTDLLLELGRQLRLEIAHEFQERAAGQSGGGNGWYGDEQDGEGLQVHELCQLLEQFLRHGYTPGPTLLDAAATFAVTRPGTPLGLAEAADLSSLLCAFRHHPGDRLLGELVKAAALVDPCSSAEVIAKASEAVYSCTQLGAYRLPGLPVAAGDILARLTALAASERGLCSSSTPWRRGACRMLWCLGLAGALERGGTNEKMLKAVSRAMAEEAAIGGLHSADDISCLASLSHAVQLAGLASGGGLTVQEEMRGRLGPALAVACQRAQHIHTHGVHGSRGVMHVTLQRALGRRGEGRAPQVFLDDGQLVDFLLQSPQGKVAVVLESPTDRLANRPDTPLGSAQVRRSLLAGAGFEVVPISELEWNSQRTAETQAKFLDNVLGKPCSH